ncbi:MAG: hypothetical protein RLZZ623_1799, partial [Actinomycetota bacterium]
MQLRLLGNMQIRDDRGEVLPAGPLKRRIVVAVLGLSPGSVISNESLIDAIWGDAPPPSALGTLRGLIAGARRDLGAAFILSHPDGYSVRLERTDVDACRFEDAVHTRQSLATALGWFSGEALHGLGDGLVIAAERDRLRALRLVAVERWAQDELAAGRHDDVIVTIERELIGAPWHESLWATLMVALYRAHRQTDALAAFQRVRTILADELGLDPGPRLCEVERQILSHDPVLLGAVGLRRVPLAGEAPGGASSSALAPAHSTPFIGRLGELDRLVGRLPSSSVGTVSMIVGEPGIGKSRLARELAAIAMQRGVLVLWGQARDGGWASPYSPFVEAVERHVASIGPDAARSLLRVPAAALANVMPAVRELFPSLPEESPASSDEVTARILRGFRRVLDDLASVQAVLLVIDDLHWADRSTLALVDHLVETTAEWPLSIVGTYRDSEVDEHHPLSISFDSLHRAVPVERLRLRGLSTGAVRDLVDELAGPSRVGIDAEELRRATGGNPFYLNELIRFRRESGSREVPDSVVDTVRHRLARLSPSAQSMMRIGALFDQQFPFEATRRVANL